MCILCVRSSIITFGKTQVIDRIEQVGFTHAIRAANTYDPGGEAKASLNIVFKLN